MTLLPSFTQLHNTIKYCIICFNLTCTGAAFLAKTVSLSAERL